MAQLLEIIKYPALICGLALLPWLVMAGLMLCYRVTLVASVLAIIGLGEWKARDEEHRQKIKYRL